MQGLRFRVMQWGRPWSDFWVGKIPWRKDRVPSTEVVFPCGSAGKESPCSLWGPNSWTWLSRFHFHFHMRAEVMTRTFVVGLWRRGGTGWNHIEGLASWLPSYLLLPSISPKQSLLWQIGDMEFMGKSLCHVWLFVTPWTIACQAPLSMEFSRQEYWRELPFPSPGDLPDPGIEPGSLASQADSLPSELPGKPMEFILVVKSWAATD